MKYQGIIDWEGYSRGYMVVEVEANSKEEAEESIKDYSWDREIYREVIRDDTEKDVENVSDVGEVE